MSEEVEEILAKVKTKSKRTLQHHYMSKDLAHRSLLVGQITREARLARFRRQDGGRARD